MSRPSSLPEWNTGGANRVEPLSGKKTLGWANLEILISSWLNWWMNLVYLWLVYLDAVAVNGPRRLLAATVSSYDTVASGLAGTPQLLIAYPKVSGGWIFGGNTNGAGKADLAYAAGSSFTALTLATTNPLVNADGAIASIADRTGLAVAVSAAGKIVSSADGGVNWTSRTPVGGTTSFSAVRASSARFVAAYNGGLQSSDDAVTWTNRLAVTGTPWALEYLNGLWVAVLYTTADNTARIYTSSDGITWTMRQALATGSNRGVFLTYLRGAWKMIDTDLTSGAWTSSDGVTWTNYTTSTVTGDWTSVGGISSITRAIMVDDDVAAVMHTGNAGFFISTDGITWKQSRDVNFTMTGQARECVGMDPLFGVVCLVGATASVGRSRFSVLP